MKIHKLITHSCDSSFAVLPPSSRRRMSVLLNIAFASSACLPCLYNNIKQFAKFGIMRKAQTLQITLSSKSFAFSRLNRVHDVYVATIICHTYFRIWDDDPYTALHIQTAQNTDGETLITTKRANKTFLTFRHHLFAFQIISWFFRYVCMPAFWSFNVLQFVSNRPLDTSNSGMWCQ